MCGPVRVLVDRSTRSWTKAARLYSVVRLPVDQGVAAGAASQRVDVRPTVQMVVAGPAEEDVVAAETADHIVP